MRIILDTMGGGDEGPGEIVKGGAIEAIKELGVDIVLVGEEELIKKRNYLNTIILVNLLK